MTTMNNEDPSVHEQHQAREASGFKTLALGNAA